MFGSHHRSVLWKKELNHNPILIIRTERPHNTKFLPTRPLYFRSHFASSSQCWHFCTGQVHQPTIWWKSALQTWILLKFVIQKRIKTGACRKAGYRQQWSPVLFANTLLQMRFNCIYVGKCQRDFRVLRHFLGSTAAGKLPRWGGEASGWKI